MRCAPCSRRNKDVAAGSAFTRPCGAWPCGFSVMWPQRRVRAVPCLHLSRASRDAGYASPLRSRSLLHVCRDFPVVHPLRFRGLTLPTPASPCASGCGFHAPCASPPYRARLLWARHRPVPGVTMEDSENVCCCTCLHTLEPGTNTTVEASPDAGLT